MAKRRTKKKVAPREAARSIGDTQANSALKPPRRNVALLSVSLVLFAIWLGVLVWLMVESLN